LSEFSRDKTHPNAGVVDNCLLSTCSLSYAQALFCQGSGVYNREADRPMSLQQKREACLLSQRVPPT